MQCLWSKQKRECFKKDRSKVLQSATKLDLMSEDKKSEGFDLVVLVYTSSSTHGVNLQLTKNDEKQQKMSEVKCGKANKWLKCTSIKYRYVPSVLCILLVIVDNHLQSDRHYENRNGRRLKQQRRRKMTKKMEGNIVLMFPLSNNNKYLMRQEVDYFTLVEKCNLILTPPLKKYFLVRIDS